MNAICLTDSPRVAALKREFAALSTEDADLMTGELTPAQFDRLMEIRQRKLVIFTEVFNAEPTINQEEQYEASAVQS